MFLMSPIRGGDGKTEEDVSRIFRQSYSRVTCFGMDVYEYKAPTILLGEGNVNVELCP